MDVDSSLRKKGQEFGAEKFAVCEGDQNIRFKVGDPLSFVRAKLFKFEEGYGSAGNSGNRLGHRRGEYFLTPSLGRGGIAENRREFMLFSDGFEARYSYGRTSGEQHSHMKAITSLPGARNASRPFRA